MLPILLTLYLFVSTILLMNMLIAIFTYVHRSESSFNNVKETFSERFAVFERFWRVNEIFIKNTTKPSSLEHSPQQFSLVVNLGHAREFWHFEQISPIFFHIDLVLSRSKNNSPSHNYSHLKNLLSDD